MNFTPLYYLHITYLLGDLPNASHIVQRATSKHITDFIGEERFHDILVNAIIVFLACTLLMMLWVLMRRLIAQLSKLRKAHIRKSLEEHLVAFIVADDEALNDLAYEKSSKKLFNLLSKKKFNYNNRLHRELFLPILLDTLQCLKGNDAIKIRRLYFHLNYHHDAIRTLRTPSAWYSKGEAIKQLRLMEVNTAIQDILLHTNHESIAIQTAAMQAHISMVPKYPLQFLATYKGKLTHWQQAALYETLRRYHEQHLPDFQTWLMHHNPNVVVFVIRMIHAFHQVDAVPNLIIAMHHENDSVKKVALKAIMELADSATLQTLQNSNTATSIAPISPNAANQ